MILNNPRFQMEHLGFKWNCACNAHNLHVFIARHAQKVVLFSVTREKLHSQTSGKLRIGQILD